MLNKTTSHLEKYDNQHDFERNATDLLNALGHREVTPIAPKGGSDGGRDITFKTANDKPENGLACVTLRKDVMKKFHEDFDQRQPGDYDLYVFICSAYLTSGNKLEMTAYCATQLKARLIIYDIEGLRSLYDSSFQSLRLQHFKIPPNSHTGLNEEHVRKLEEENRKVKEDLSQITRMHQDLLTANDLSDDVEFRDYAIFRKSTENGPFCSPCWSVNSRLIPLHQDNEYWWECKVCKEIFCSDREAYDRETELAMEKHINRSSASKSF